MLRKGLPGCSRMMQKMIAVTPRMSRTDTIRRLSKNFIMQTFLT